MNRPHGIRVRHCVLTTLARRHGSRPVFDLLEVRYDHEVPSNVEFPRIVPQFDLFLRVFANSAGPTRLRVRVYRRWNRRWDRVNEYTANRPLPFPRHGPSVFDYPFRMPYVNLT